MKLFARSIVIAMACVALSVPAFAKQTAAQKKTIDIIRTTFEKTKNYPYDSALYADKILVSHNYDEPKLQDRDPYLAGIAKEQTMISPANRELLRFLATDEWAVASIASKGPAGADGKPQISKITWFFRVNPEGKITEKETWRDRGMASGAAPRTPAAPPKP